MMREVHDTKYNRRCDTCIHWLSSESQKVVVRPGGIVPLDTVLTQDGLRAGENVQTVAPCTACPQWTTTMPFHFCGHFEGNTKY